MLNLTTVTDQHSSQGTELSRQTYQTIMHQPMLNLTTVTDQHSSQSTNLSRHTYQTIMHQPMLNLTTVTDQHSSQGTELSRHTYQTTCTNRCELNDYRCQLNKHSRPTFLARYQTQPTLGLQRYTHLTIRYVSRYLLHDTIRIAIHFSDLR